MSLATPSAKEAVLDSLLGPGQIRIAFHGIHDLQRDDAIVGNEALMRGPRGTPYESPPLAFAMAATLDMMERLDCHCIGKAAQSQTPGLLFLNVHPRTLVGYRQFWGLVGSFGSAPFRSPQEVVFEIVEHSPARERDLPEALLELRALGFKIAIDDLGEGMSGLRRVVELAPDYAKIDRFFVTGIDRDPRRRAVVAAVATMGRDMGIEVIAEGVETLYEKRVLADLGIRLAQGYLFGRPMETIS